MKKTIACVTGANGLIGNEIVEKLLRHGYEVRVITRSPYHKKKVNTYRGCITDKNKMRIFLDKADIVIHCAAELKNEQEMWKTNVLGTKIIVELVQENNGIKYFCYLSSAGVIGKANKIELDEHTPCNPENIYEKTKYEAERVVSEKLLSCKKIILRPTNVVGNKVLGNYKYFQEQSLFGWLKIFLIGAECCHVVHCEDVAEAAIFFITHTNNTNSDIFIVSLDDEKNNNIANFWRLYREQMGLMKIPILHLPLKATYIFRKVFRRKNNSGMHIYTSKKILCAGFEYKNNIESIVRNIYIK
jgi:nucleoside-diphosphate-sugar epimerase